MELKSRKDIPTELTWDLSSIYATEEEMYRDVEKLKSLGGRMAADYKGKLDTPRTIGACLDDLRELTEETDEAKRAEKASRILANLQKILED